MKLCLILLPVLVGYLLGSVSFAVIFARAFTGRDVRRSGSGNAGTTNVLRVAGRRAGFLTFLCDALKGAAASLVGLYAFSSAFEGDTGAYAVLGAYVGGVSCMVGHALPVFFHFKGGKCAATGVGVFAVCCPVAIGVGLAVYTLVMIAKRIVSLSTLTATAVTVAIAVGYALRSALPLTCLLPFAAGGIICGRHAENIRRLIAGTESKLVLKPPHNKR